MQQTLRCAVYTRKSTEEGLDQEFNSLDAQREACEAYIASQAGLGWRLAPGRYDDGGISGGTMERPALQALLADIKERRIDIVVVYKIDRLTRSLGDFAKIMDVLDAASASFVSVTQAFNTTTSMGRLTLNVLLSFAQFEREVTAERIRDKIAASKRKGMWMGGVVSLGYRVENRKLLIEEKEAELVRQIFARYLELGSVQRLVDELQSKELEVRRPIPRKSSNGSYKAKPFARGNLFHLLSNPIYIGKIRHRTELHKGEHEAIIDADTFSKVQELLASKAPARSHPISHPDIHLLTGIAFDEKGDRLAPSHTAKGGRRYRYYISQRSIGRGSNGASKASGWRIRAERLDGLVEQELLKLLRNGGRITEIIGTGSGAIAAGEAATSALRRAEEWSAMPPGEKKEIGTRFIRRVELRASGIRIEFSRIDLMRWIDPASTDNSKTGPGNSEPPIVVERPLSIRRRGVETRLIVIDGSRTEGEPDEALIDLLIRAQVYLADLTDGSGRTLAEVAALNGTDPSEVSRLLPLAFLSPRIVEAIIFGSQPDQLTPLRLSRLSPLPLAWDEQEAILVSGKTNRRQAPDTLNTAAI